MPPPPRDQFIALETLDLRCELELRHGHPNWDRALIKGAEQAAGERWDDAMALYLSYDDEEDGFHAVYSRYDADLAQYIDDAINGPAPVRAPMPAEQLAAHDVAMAELAARVAAEEAAERRAA